jgi:hypothetical protein
MTKLLLRRSAAIILIACLSLFTQAQPLVKTENKPYKILTNGKQVTVKSNKTIQSVMVWTASGHRVIEERNVNNSSFSFNLNINEKIFFLMIQLEGSKPYTEKIGLQ